MVTRAGPDRYRLLDTLAPTPWTCSPTSTQMTRANGPSTTPASPRKATWRPRIRTARVARPVRSDVHNFRRLEWSLLTGNVDRAAREAGALAWFWTLNGMLTEAIGHLERLVGVETTPAAIRARCAGLRAAGPPLGRLTDARDAGYLAAGLGRDGGTRSQPRTG